jgi:deferrochelatase/peroxidase EfeB
VAVDREIVTGKRSFDRMPSHHQELTVGEVAREDEDLHSNPHNDTDQACRGCQKGPL